MAELALITTADGSHSLFNPELNETYHSIHGALQESMLVFIANGLTFFQKVKPQSEIRILEIGFGTGLNALLTLRHIGDSETKIHYTTLDPYPVPEEILGCLNYPAMIHIQGNENPFRQMHACPWGENILIEKNFTLVKKLSRVQECVLGTGQFDLIYFDAFGPGKQPEMWELPVLSRIEQSMSTGAVFVTYSAKGQLKRDLKSLGLLVETLPGPPGKKEMVRALKS